jgi:hypothetical protein
MDRFSSSSSDSSWYNGGDLKRSTGRHDSGKLWCTTALTNFTLLNSFKHVLSPRISPAQNVLKSSASSIGSQVETLSPPPIIAATTARNIFLSTPCAVAGESLSGKINVLPRAKLDRHSSHSLILELIGAEGTFANREYAWKFCNRCDDDMALLIYIQRWLNALKEIRRPTSMCFLSKW